MSAPTVKIEITIGGKLQAVHLLELKKSFFAAAEGQGIVFEDAIRGRGVLVGWEFTPTIRWIDDWLDDPHLRPLLPPAPTSTPPPPPTPSPAPTLPPAPKVHADFVHPGPCTAECL